MAQQPSLTLFLTRDAVRLFTSFYNNKTLAGAGFAPVRITMGYPRFKLAYTLAGTVKEIAPRRSYFYAPADEFAGAYRAQLDELGVDRIRALLAPISSEHEGRDLALVCFEKPGEPCHRRQFAAWWEEQTGEIVAELPFPTPPAPSTA